MALSFQGVNSLADGCTSSAPRKKVWSPESGVWSPLRGSHHLFFILSVPGSRERGKNDKTTEELCKGAVDVVDDDALKR
jgi:hypothetical protein